MHTARVGFQGTRAASTRGRIVPRPLPVRRLGQIILPARTAACPPPVVVLRVHRTADRPHQKRHRRGAETIRRSLAGFGQVLSGHL